MTTDVKTEIVPARPEHADFIAWVQLAASRSHTDTSIWEVYLDRDEATALAFLKALNSTEKPHYGHLSTFHVARGRWRARRRDVRLLRRGARHAGSGPGVRHRQRRVGFAPADVAAGMERIKSYQYCSPTHVPGAWIVEWVATKPEFRRQGLIERLLAFTLEVGRQRGATVGEIGVLIGNDPAQRAYEKAGFRQVQELTHPEYEAAFHTPGLRLLRRDL